MLLEQVDYVRPVDIDEALALLAEVDGAAPLAGGQSLVNVLKNRVASVDLLVDISRLPELREIGGTPDGGLEIGACVTYDELDRTPAVRVGHWALAEVAAHIEDQQIRNKGTIGGNCCLSDPTNNLPPILVALDAVMNLRSRSGGRSIAAVDFFKGYFATALEPGELLVSVSVPAMAEGSGAGYASLLVAADAKAMARAAAWVQLSTGGSRIAAARVVLARVANVPVRDAAVEAKLAGAEASDAVVRNACAQAAEGLRPLADVHGSSDYRREMAKVMARRAVAQAIGEARGVQAIMQGGGRA
jgi:aerobic carbon-monoxide dehydrogenase medium subunit